MLDDDLDAHLHFFLNSAVQTRQVLYNGVFKGIEVSKPLFRRTFIKRGRLHFQPFFENFRLFFFTLPSHNTTSLCLVPSVTKSDNVRSLKQREGLPKNGLLAKSKWLHVMLLALATPIAALTRYRASK